MEVEWDYTAEVFLDQLPSQEQAKVIHAVQRLATARDGETQLTRVAGVENDLYSLRVAGDLLVLVRKGNGTINVVDVVRRSQVEALRRLHKQGQSAAE
jgi:mRNA-degrading endonuclease RelE of RelBE toxin-antitoxin system